MRLYDTFTTLLTISAATCALAQYNLVRDFTGNSFFDGFEWFSGTDWNLTNGDVNFLSLGNATTQRLTYVDDNQHLILRVDNTTNVPWNEKRDSVRLESKDAFPIGSLLLFDAYHLPYGCSVWPAFWTAGTEWPENGEIDIVEAVNEMTFNQVALHTNMNKTCGKVPGVQQSGADGNPDCATLTGCTVRETKPNSYGAAFAAARGGVWATQIDASGIYIWFWSRPDVPQEISSNQSTLNPTSWGVPTAAYPSGASCNISDLFGPQRIIIDTTLCGDWAGNHGVYNTSTCRSTAPPKTGKCYDDNVVGDGSNYANAYFDIGFVRAYTLANVQVVTNSTTTTTAPGSSSTATSATSASSTASASSTTGTGIIATLPADNNNGGRPTLDVYASYVAWILFTCVVGSLSAVSLLA